MTVNRTPLADDHSASLAAGICSSLREAADLLATLPDDLAKASYVVNYGGSKTNVQWFLTINGNAGDAGQKATAARLVRLIGGAWGKDFSDEVGTYTQTRGTLRLTVQVDRAEVCARVVTGTREVVREVPARPAVEAHTVTEVVEDVEWKCEPLLTEQVPVVTPAHLAADESRDARNTDALADVNADTLAWEARG